MPLRFLEANITHVKKSLIQGIAFALVAGPAAAQQATGAVTPEFVANGAYEATLFKGLPGFGDYGIKSEDFLLRSQISSGVAYDSNVLRTQSSVPDYIFFLAPAFDLTRDGGNHVEEVAVSIVSAKYAKSEADDFNSIFVNASETYLLSPGSKVLLNALFVDGYERRISSNHDIPSDAAMPVHYQGLLGSLGYSITWENFTAGTTLTASRRTFDDVESTAGAILDQTFRDENDFSLQSFLNFRLSDHVQSNLIFLAVRSDIREQVRSTNLWKLSDAIKVDLTSKTSFGFYASVREQDFYNNPQAQIRPLGEYEAFLRWSPMQRLTFTAKSGYHDLGVDFTKGILNGGAGRYASLEAIYLIRRNLQLVSSLSYETDHLSGNQGMQTSLSGRVAVTYEISSSAGLSFLYALQKLDATSAQFTSYDESVFQTALNLRF